MSIKITLKQEKPIITIKNNGSPGLNGSAGLSAYEIALNNGFSGTETEWLVSLKGEQGQSSNIQIGTTTTLNPEQNASVTNSGTALNPILNFSIPKGIQGVKGDPGDSSTLQNIGTGIGIWKETVGSIAKLKSLISENPIILINQNENNDEIVFGIDGRELSNFIGSNLEGIQTQVNFIQQNIDGISLDLSTLTINIDSINTAISDLQTIRDNITTLQSQITTANNNISSNTTAINNINTAISDLQTIRDNITTLQSQITTANNNISSNTTAITSLNNKVLPAGGTTGQVLTKIDGTDYNTQWTNQSSGGSLDLLENYSFGYVQVYSTGFNTTSSSVFLTNSQQNGYGIDSSIITQSIVAGKELFYYTPKRFYKQATNSYCSYNCGFGDLLVNTAGNGWKVTRKFGLLTANNSQQIFFAGLSSANVAMGAEQAVQSAQTLYISIGVGYDSTDTHFNFFFNGNDSIAPIKIPFNGNIIGNLSTSDYTSRTIEKVYSVTLEYNPAISSNYIKITFCNLSNGKSGYYNFYFSSMRTFNRNTTTFKTYQALRYAETGSFDTMAFFYDCYRHNLPSIV